MKSVNFRQSPNYTQGRGGQPIKAVCLHTMAGTYNGSISWFLNPSSQSSTHFLISFGGEITQMVNELDMAWANGMRWNGNTPLNARGRQMEASKLGQLLLDNKGLNPNLYTISIELEGRPEDEVTPKMYEAVLKILRYLRDTYGIKFTRYNLIGHYQIDHIDRPNCPGSRVDFDRILNTLNLDSSPKPNEGQDSSSGSEFTTVLNGWGISNIALALGMTNWQDRTSWDYIAQLNNFSKYEEMSLSPGQKVRIRPKQIAQPQEDLKMIAELQNKITNMENADKIEDADFLQQIKNAEGSYINLKKLAEETLKQNIILITENEEFKVQVANLQTDIHNMQLQHTSDITALQESFTSQINTLKQEFETTVQVKDSKIQQLEITISAFSSTPSKPVEREVINNINHRDLPSPFMALWKKFQNAERFRTLRMFITHFSKDIFGIGSLWVFTYAPILLDQFFNNGVPNFVNPEMARTITEYWLIIRVPATALLAKQKANAMKNSEEIAKRLNSSVLSNLLLPGVSVNK